MYIITCGNENDIVMEPETGYVPNNPLFGLPAATSQLDKDCISTSSCDGCGNCEAYPLASSEYIDCGSCLDHSNLIGPTTQLSQSNSTGNSNYWSEEMGSLPGLPPLDLVEPLPSLFPFSPCGVSYKNERSHDVADVLLSLKHAVLKPSPEPSSQSSHYNGPSGSAASGGGPHQASLSYTVHHPHQMLVPSGNHHQSHHLHHHHHPHQSGSSSMANYYDTNGQYSTSVPAPPPPPPSLYPSMSVNVSMNMTMHHGYGHGAESGLQCAQGDNFLQWTPPPPNSSQMNLYPPVMSPQHYPNSATYSITADFRPPSSTSHSLNSYAPGHHSAATQNLFDPFAHSRSISPDAIAQRSSVSGGGANGYYGTSPPDNTTPSPHHLLNTLQKSPHYNSPSDCVLNGTSYEESHEMPGGLLEGNGVDGDSVATAGVTTLKIRPELKGSMSFGEEDEDSRDSCSETKPNLCRLCGKTYARPSTLKTHLRTHSGERPYRCPDCNKSFSQAANLTAHVRTHTGQKPFRCPICQRQFSQSSSVTTHMRTHSGERPYRCRACKKAFSDSSTLTKHLRIHSGEKPYQCKLCLLRFSQSGNLNRHMRVHGTNGNGGSSGTGAVSGIPT